LYYILYCNCFRILYLIPRDRETDAIKAAMHLQSADYLEQKDNKMQNVVGQKELSRHTGLFGLRIQTVWKAERHLKWLELN